MSVEDDAYARLVRMHAAKRQTSEASEGLASFAENARRSERVARHNSCEAAQQPRQMLRRLW